MLAAAVAIARYCRRADPDSCKCVFVTCKSSALKLISVAGVLYAPSVNVPRTAVPTDRSSPRSMAV